METEDSTADITWLLTTSDSAYAKQAALEMTVTDREEGDTDGPIKALRGFSRAHLAAGESRTVSVEIAPKALEWWDNESNTMRPLAGRYEVMVGGDSQDESLQRMWITIEN